jgi:hypothetical protein
LLFIGLMLLFIGFFPIFSKRFQYAFAIFAIELTDKSLEINLFLGEMCTNSIRDF